MLLGFQLVLVHIENENFSYFGHMAFVILIIWILNALMSDKLSDNLRG